MNALLVRVAADETAIGGGWNGPVDAESGEFVYVPILEHENLPLRPGLDTRYDTVLAALDAFGVDIPAHLVGRTTHLDPDFDHLTYGDHGARGKRIRETVGAGDLLVFYAALRDVRRPELHAALSYAIIGRYVVDEIVRAIDAPEADWHRNAHTRRAVKPEDDDIVVRARYGESGRLRRCIPIGEYRDGAYRVRLDLLEAWGGLSIRDGYIQRSAYLPRFLDADCFRRWFDAQHPELIQANNPATPPACPRIFIYKMTSDDGGAPCAEDGLLSLAICKPMIRTAAAPGDLIFGFAANALHRDNRLLYVARVTEKLGDGRYYDDPRYRRRGDCIYERRDDGFVWRDGARHHGPESVTHDLGAAPDHARANVLLSTDFRYFGATGTAAYKDAYPIVRIAVESLARGHRVNHRDPALYDELIALKGQIWRDCQASTTGRPSSAPQRRPCHRDEEAAVVTRCGEC